MPLNKHKITDCGAGNLNPFNMRPESLCRIEPASSIIFKNITKLKIYPLII